ncbi:MAG TPA: SGNH/GDSL hydrolase family protein [Caldimonas sp.]|nr:SGNH/GDSL hydrolase family protein [Caldimonas sp.]HEV7576125.1 SGNH/GDSL hydrolase family protein [Caldimonas sp.]
MTPLSLRRLLPALALAAAALASAPASAGPYSALVVFGDSLSDNGNNAAAGLFDPTQVIGGNGYVPTNTYAAGTYSNGLVWASDFAAMIGLPLAPSLVGGSDFAFGGATTGTPGPGPGGFPYSLLVQTNQYLGATGNHASPTALYVVAGGGNDVRGALAAIAGGADVGATIASTALSFAANVGTIVDELQAAGAQHIIVWDTPNVGLAPAVVAAGGADLATFLAGSMNAALAARLAGEAGVSTFDIFGLGTQIALHPALFGFTNVTDACGALVGANCSQYAYWDGIHPTAAAHLAIAGAFAVVAVPEPETWALFAAGLAVLGWTSRRRAKTIVAT